MYNVQRIVVHCGCTSINIHRRGVSCCSFRQNWAMRRPLHSGASNGIDSTFFMCLYVISLGVKEKRNSMKKLFLLISILCIGYNVSAQQKHVRRVYYLDVTESMKGYVSPKKTYNRSSDIWKDVCNNLKEAIDNVHDETTELIVIPFSDAKLGCNMLVAKATEEGKTKLKKQIDDLDTHMHYTNLSIPLTHFCNLSFSNDITNYMFLMTDGVVNKEADKFYSLLRQWDEKFGHKKVYGFYVMLHENAHDAQVSTIINGEKNLWLANTADVNINIIQLEEKATFNVKNESFVDIPITTTIGKVNANIQVMMKDEDYQIQKCAVIDNNKLRVYIIAKANSSNPPSFKKIILKVIATPNDEYTFVVTDAITLTCKNEKEYTLKITVK